MSRDGLAKCFPPSPQRDEPTSHVIPVLDAQQDAEEDRRRQRVMRWSAARHEHRCAEDNETTAWRQLAKWADTFRNRPIDILTATAKHASPAAWEDDGLRLGTWKGEMLVSPAATESLLQLVMCGADDILTWRKRRSGTPPILRGAGRRPTGPMPLENRPKVEDQRNPTVLPLRARSSFAASALKNRLTHELESSSVHRNQNIDGR